MNIHQVRMERRHFEVIAEIISKLDEADIFRASVARHFANNLAQTNPNFNREKFIAASTGKKK